MTKCTTMMSGLAVLLGLSSHTQAQEGDALRGSESHESDADVQASRDTSATGLSGLDVEAIKAIQRQLRERALYSGSVDGIAGPMTIAALRTFQQRQGLRATGAWDDSTAAALSVDMEHTGGTDPLEADRPKTEPPTVELSSLSPAQIRELQQRLGELGHYDGEIDGVVGPRTRAALGRFFQQQAQLVARGELSDAAMNALEIDAQRWEPMPDIEVQDSPRPSTDREPVKEAE
jgi:peptidoglycan hydrolase-like protein with peptidoglycan-binding domain